MMPGLDGFGLLKKIRNHPQVGTTPVIFLSARAGEESKVEGLEAGADDYLVKPFSARELIARVDSNLRMNAARRLVDHRKTRFESLKDERHPPAIKRRSAAIRRCSQP